MANERSKKIPVTERQFLWVQDDDKGEVTLHVGPTMVSPTASDRVVVDDGDGGFREAQTDRPQQMIELGDNQYAVLSNPLAEAADPTSPNGKFKQGRNESRPLKSGTRQMIAGPTSFYLRPGQRAEVRDAHKLASNQYLVVEVYGEVDKAAPYYDVTARSASIVRSTDGDDAGDGGKGDGGKGEKKPAASGAADLRRGRLIVIRGLDTQFYVPPTGVDIVPDTSVNASGASVSAAEAQALLALGEDNGGRRHRRRGHQQQAGSQQVLAANAGVALADFASPVYGSYEALGNISPHEKLGMKGFALDPMARKTAEKRLAGATHDALEREVKSGSQPVLTVPAGGQAQGGAVMMAVPTSMADDVESNEALRRQLEREARQARLIRNAVVLGEKEYCVIIDADGKREIKVGPARVFPGPYDTFQIAGSRNRVYDAYELLPTRALWLRVISKIGKDAMAKKLPHGFKLETTEKKEQYVPGDELLLTGVSTFFVPFNEIEVLSPDTGQAVIGNDHTQVFIESIGIDQKSGIYVRDLATGEVKLVRGKQCYLVDPRKEVHVTRTLSVEQWNLWIAAQEPHKATHAPVTTPWAISVTVPPNTAVLATSAKGQRVIEGPRVELLEYEENLAPVTLSTGTPKSDVKPLKTCYLRIGGVRVSDQVSVETSDFVRISVRTSYGISFAPDARERWFTHEDFVKFMTDHLRSLVRGRCRTIALKDLWPQLPAVVRDTILGEKAQDGKRAGRAFQDNGLQITEVEVLTAQLEDPAISALLTETQKAAVVVQIGDKRAQEDLASAKLRAGIAKETSALEAEALERKAQLEERARMLRHASELAMTRERESIERERVTLAIVREAEVLKAKLEREAQEHRAKLSYASGDVEAIKLRNEADVEHRQKISAIETALIQAKSAATVAEHQSVQRGLIEAMVGLGDRIMLGEVAENMNLVTLFKGKDVGSILKEVVGGTKLAETVAKLGAGAAGIVGANGDKNRVAGALASS